MYFLSASSGTLLEMEEEFWVHTTQERIGRQAGQAGVETWWDLGEKELPASQLSSCVSS